jgi:hypothetical protein
VAAIKDLAKTKPYLVKQSDAGPSGSSMGGGRKGDDKGADKAALKSRFPVLGQRS